MNINSYICKYFRSSRKSIKRAPILILHFSQKIVIAVSVYFYENNFNNAVSQMKVFCMPASIRIQDYRRVLKIVVSICIQQDSPHEAIASSECLPYASITLPTANDCPTVGEVIGMNSYFIPCQEMFIWMSIFYTVPAIDLFQPSSKPEIKIQDDH